MAAHYCPGCGGPLLLGKLSTLVAPELAGACVPCKAIWTVREITDPKADPQVTEVGPLSWPIIHTDFYSGPV